MNQSYYKEKFEHNNICSFGDIASAQVGERFSILPMSIAHQINYSSCSSTEGILRKLGWEHLSYAALKRDATVLVVEYTPTGAAIIGRIHAVPAGVKIPVSLKNEQSLKDARRDLEKERYIESDQISLMTKSTESQQGGRKVYIENTLIFECSGALNNIVFIEYR